MEELSCRRDGEAIPTTGEFLKKWKKFECYYSMGKLRFPCRGSRKTYECLEELSMGDDTDPRKTAMYKLSNNGALNDFKYVVLVSSTQDQYAPFESARIEMGDETPDAAKPQMTEVYKEMVNNIWHHTKADVARFDVTFKLQGKNIDTFLGRAAHIQFLENQIFMRMLVQCYPQFFS